MRARWIKGIFAALTVIALIFALGYAVKFAFQDDQSDASGAQIARLAADSRAPIRINEVMTRNRSAYLNRLHAYTGYVELTNISGKAVNIGGYVLTKQRVAAKRFVCPFVELQPGECLLVFASGTLFNDPARDLHAPFTLGSGDNTLFLTAPNGDIADAVLVPPLGINQVFSRDADTRTWSITDFYSPGSTNSYQSHMAIVELSRANRSTATLRITELLSRNVSTNTDEDNQFSDWVEIENTGDKPINLSGFALSNNSARPMKWLFSSATIEPDAYMLVFCSGKNRTPTDGELHTNFKISTEKEMILFSDNQGKLIDQVSILNNKADRSFGRDSTGMWTVFAQPTPGTANTLDNQNAIETAMRNRNASGLFLSEVMTAYNDPMDRVQSYDWVELHNEKTIPFELEGYGLSDDQSAPRKWQFPPGVSIGAGEYMVVRLTGYDRYSETTKAYHTNFKLSSDGDETISLSNPDGKIIDKIPLQKQYLNLPYGRFGGKAGFFYLANATPGAPNGAYTYAGKITEVIASSRGGMLAGDALLKLTCLSDAEIRYTLDCSEPTIHSAPYTTPIPITGTTIVRAKAFRSGYLPSDTLTIGYYAQISHTTPVVALVIDPADFMGDSRGIYKNFTNNMEKPANMTYFDESGYAQVSQDLGIKIAGSLSRTQDQKAFMLTARKKYSRDVIPYNPFLDRTYPAYRAWVLRAGGQDAKRTHMRDILAASLLEGSGLLTQDYRLVAVYVNGQYFGQYDLRERINKYSVAQFLGAPDEFEHVNLLAVNGLVVSGGSTEFRDLIAFVEKNPLTERKNLDYVTARVDVDSLFKYHIYSMIFGNMDMTNQKMFKLRAPNHKWQWAAFDFDEAFGASDYDNVSRNLNPKGIAVGSVTMNNALIRALLDVPDMRDRFLMLFGDTLMNKLTSDNMLAAIDRIASELAPDLPAQFVRWGGSVAAWQRAVNELREFAQTRPGYVLGHLKAYFALTDAEMARYFGLGA